ncbi:MAG: ABC transporter permease subunit [Oligoflexus sp.]
MRQFIPLFKREFFAYFRSPLAYVFIVIFLLASVGCTFFIGKLYDSNQASLTSFFSFLPWLQLVLIPAVGMRLWAEERHSGTIELLFTLPVTLTEAVIAKFMAGWAFISITLLLTFGLAFTVAYLGDPDWGVICSSYLAGIFMGGAFLGISSMVSALTKNQVIAFILGVVISFFMIVLGWGVFTNILATIFPVFIVDTIATLGVMPHFTPMIRGVIDSRDLVYFLLLIGTTLSLNAMILQHKKAT